MVEEKHMSATTAFVIDLGGTFLCQLSYLLMKKAHVDVEKQISQSSSAYCSSKFFGGSVCLITGSLIHLLVLPFCPLVLLAMNSATAIVISALLAIQYLGERIVWRYDLAALLFIAVGCTGIVILSHSTENQLTSAEVEK